jgi:hypothetical protein
MQINAAEREGIFGWFWAEIELVLTHPGKIKNLNLESLSIFAFDFPIIGKEILQLRTD